VRNPRRKSRGENLDKEALLKRTGGEKISGVRPNLLQI